MTLLYFPNLSWNTHITASPERYPSLHHAAFIWSGRWNSEFIYLHNMYAWKSKLQITVIVSIQAKCQVNICERHFITTYESNLKYKCTTTHTISNIVLLLINYVSSYKPILRRSSTSGGVLSSTWICRRFVCQSCKNISQKKDPNDAAWLTIYF